MTHIFYPLTDLHDLFLTTTFFIVSLHVHAHYSVPILHELSWEIQQAGTVVKLWSRYTYSSRYMPDYMDLCFCVFSPCEKILLVCRLLEGAGRVSVSDVGWCATCNWNVSLHCVFALHFLQVHMAFKHSGLVQVLNLLWNASPALTLEIKLVRGAMPQAAPTCILGDKIMLLWFIPLICLKMLPPRFTTVKKMEMKLTWK